jgi:predicted XRE-type DNA-binding protein
MARAKRCEEEFNPWPPFVDVFSSVVLVLLLFILVLIVNVAYYTQFNSKVNTEAKTKSIKDNLQAGMDVSDMISLHKIVKPKLDAAGRDSMFSGGKNEGNSLSSSGDNKKDISQDVKKISSKELMVSYNGSDIFLQDSAKSKIKNFIKKNRESGKKITISMAYPTNVISTTMKKKISISRIVNVKNALKKFGVKLSDMKIKINRVEDKKYKNGYIKIKIE